MRAFDGLADHDPPYRAEVADSAAGAWAALAQAPDCCLTSKDYTLLEGHLARIDNGTRPLLARLLRLKLPRARVVLTRDVDPDIATGGSRIAFAATHEGERTRILVHWSDNRVLGECLRVTALLGATLLGMRAGQSAPLLRADGTVARVTLNRIVFQPEAAKPAARWPDV